MNAWQWMVVWSVLVLGGVAFGSLVSAGLLSLGLFVVAVTRG